MPITPTILFMVIYIIFIKKCRCLSIFQHIFHNILFNDTVFCRSSTKKSKINANMALKVLSTRTWRARDSNLYCQYCKDEFPSKVTLVSFYSFLPPPKKRGESDWSHAMMIKSNLNKFVLTGDKLQSKREK